MTACLIILGILLLILFVVWMAEAVGPKDAVESDLWDRMLWQAVHKPPDPQTPLGQRIEAMHGDYTQLILKRRRAQEGGKMKLEIGKWYETEYGIFQAKIGWVHNTVSLNGILYEKNFDASGCEADPRVIREVPAPLKLEVGKLYAMEGGGVERCEANPYGPTPYKFIVGGNFYKEDGSPAAFHYRRILHKLRVNEHMEAAAPNDVSDITHYAFYGMRHDGSLTDRLAVHPSDCFPGYRAFREKQERDRILREAKAEQARREAAPMSVQYHPHSDCGKREPIVPEGWEVVTECHGSELWDMLTDIDGKWVSPARCQPDVGATIGNLLIRPIKKFRLSGPGWYKRRHKAAWLKFTEGELRSSYDETGRNLLSGGDAFDLIARATDAQAAILDAL